jgi:hypothetical protein
VCRWLNGLVANGLDEQALTETAERLHEIASILLKDGFDRCYAIGDASSLAAVHAELPAFLSGFGADAGRTRAQRTVYDHATDRKQFATPLEPRPRTFFALPMPVNHVSLCLQGAPSAHADSPKLTVTLSPRSSLPVRRLTRSSSLSVLCVSACVCVCSCWHSCCHTRICTV